MARRPGCLVLLSDYTYSNYPQHELSELWISCVKPGGKVLTLHPSLDGKSKVPGNWVFPELAISNGHSFFSELPHHLVGIDLDSPMPENGVGARVLEYLKDRGIYFVLTTSGSNGWTLVLNLWTSLEPHESNSEYLIKNFGTKILEIKEDLKTLFPNEDWNSRVRRSIRPPLSPYPFSGKLKLISPQTVSGATKILNYGGVVVDEITPNRDSLKQALTLKSPKEKRASNYMTLANVMIQSGYHFEDFKDILSHTRTPIGIQYQSRIVEYGRNSQQVKKDLETTWVKAHKFVTQNPPIVEARRLLPEWVLYSIDLIVESSYPSTTKTRLIACVIAIANISYRASTLNPVIAESRLSTVSGVSNKSISKYKQILQELGLLTISYGDSEGFDSKYGSRFCIKIPNVPFTDIKSLLIITRGNRDITSVKRVNETHIKQQITHLITNWESHSLWLSEPSGRVSGHVLWSLMDCFPNLPIADLRSLLGWSSRKATKILNQLEVSMLAHWDKKVGRWDCYRETAHWEFLANRN